MPLRPFDERLAALTRLGQPCPSTVPSTFVPFVSFVVEEWLA